jgi:YrbI family 3-deoxy-D-manno-octulosonate 8-phosphate phosphatase
LKPSNGPVVAVVPARGGSKGLPRKNVLLLDGHPLLAYSIAAAFDSTSVDRVVCTTDDDEIADVAAQYGAEVLRRPAALAADSTPDLPVFAHVLQWLRDEGSNPRCLVQLRPTAPLRTRGLVDQCVNALDADPSATSVRTVALAQHTPYKMWRSSDSSPYLEPLLELDGVDEPFNMPRQSLPAVWWHNGSVDVIRDDVIDAGSMTGTRIAPISMPLDDSVDIDDEIDFMVASLRISRRFDVVRPSTQNWLGDVDLLISDVDGTLTPGTMHYGAAGEELKSFHTRDGLGVRLVRDAGITVALVTGESSPIVTARALKLDIGHVFLGAHDKHRTVSELLTVLGHSGKNAVFLGDDVNDLPAASLLRDRGGHFVAVADAHPTVRSAADLVLTTVGGGGALRELADRILDARCQSQSITEFPLLGGIS